MVRVSLFRLYVILTRSHNSFFFGAMPLLFLHISRDVYHEI